MPNSLYNTLEDFPVEKYIKKKRGLAEKKTDWARGTKMLETGQRVGLVFRPISFYPLGLEATWAVPRQPFKIYRSIPPFELDTDPHSLEFQFSRTLIFPRYRRRKVKMEVKIIAVLTAPSKLDHSFQPTGGS